VITNKSISLIGAGIGNTVIIGNAPGETTAILWTTKPGFSRLSGFTIGGTAGCSSGDQGGMVKIEGTSKNVRVDHVRFNSTTCGSLRIDGSVAGVADHNTFDNSAFLSHSTQVQHQSWEGVGDHGHNSWASDSTIGTDNQFYFEDNTFNNTLRTGRELYATNDDRGARTVYRFNTFNNGVYATHGTETGGTNRGFRHTELYHNVFNWSLANFSSVIGFRGGTGMVFNNTVAGDFQHLFTVTTLRRSDLWSSHPGSYPYGRCGTIAVTSIIRAGSTAIATAPNHYSHENGSYTVIAGADQPEYNRTFVTFGISPTQFTFTVSGTPVSPATGTITARSPFDGNVDGTGYRCMDQAGSGKGMLISGDGPQATDISPIAAIGNELEPIYAWNNLLNGAQSNVTVVDAADIVVADREYYNFADSFNGTTGIGVGPLADLPLTCTPGVGYWATDQGTWNTTGPDGQLYKCTSPNTWALFYEPYTYPHPLTQ
jgi:hypothetical protein